MQWGWGGQASDRLGSKELSACNSVRALGLVIGTVGFEPASPWTPSLNKCWGQHFAHTLAGAHHADALLRSAIIF